MSLSAILSLSHSNGNYLATYEQSKLLEYLQLPRMYSKVMTGASILRLGALLHLYRISHRYRPL